MNGGGEFMCMIRGIRSLVHVADPILVGLRL